MAITSSASISSAIRIKPSSAVTPTPNVAANPIPATTGATMRTSINAAKNPVSASMPMLPKELNSCTASVPPDARVKKPTSPFRPSRQNSCTHADFGDESDNLHPVTDDRERHPCNRRGVEPDLVAQLARNADGPAQEVGDPWVNSVSS